MKQKKIFITLPFLFLSFVFALICFNFKNSNFAQLFSMQTSIYNQEELESCSNLETSNSNYYNENLNSIYFSKDNKSKSDDVNIQLTYKGNIFVLDINAIALNQNIHTVKDFNFKSTHKTKYQNIVKILKKIKRMGFSDETAFNYVFAPLNQKIKEIICSINTSPIDATVRFDKTSNCFTTTTSINGTQVDTNTLYTDIIKALMNSNNVSVEIKTTSVAPKYSQNDVIKATKKQASFSTYYGSSNNDRKNNIKLACSALNGYEVLPGQIFSFNEAIGKRCIENGYKEANIIVDGEFVKGVGGGVCQVSTTLYNALLLANIRPHEVHKHSLPVSYVKPGLDAMVSWSTADLKFKNTTDLPIFITSSCNGSNLTFNIHGNTKDSNTQIKTVSQIIKTIPHKGDKIVPDTQGKYSDKIMFKGEFIREKTPKDGYIAHAYVDTYKNGNLVGHELIREVIYEPQLGLVYEGTEDLPEGMTLPDKAI